MALKDWLDKKKEELSEKFGETIEKADETLGKKIEDIKKTWDRVSEEDKKDIKKGAAGAGAGYILGGIPGLIATGYTAKKAYNVYKRHQKKNQEEQD